MHRIVIPLSDEHWRTLKEAAHLNKMSGNKPDSVTQLILWSVTRDIPGHQQDIKAALRGARKGKAC